MKRCKKCNGEGPFRSIHRWTCRACEASASRERRLQPQIEIVVEEPEWEEPTPPPTTSSDNNVVIFGDLHFPWHQREALYAALEHVTSDVSLVVQIGDAYDHHATSRFPRSHEVMSPMEELTIAKQYFDWFWGEVKSRAPNARLIQLMGNHDERPMKRVLERAPELEYLVSHGIRALYEAPGVEVITGDEFVDNGIAYVHGYMARLGDHARQALIPTVHGHSHKPGVAILRPGLWEMDVGYLGDEKAPCFGYPAWKRAAPMTRALGRIDKHGPRVILLP